MKKNLKIGSACPQGTLLELVKSICDRLCEHGWGELLLAHGLDIGAKDLAAELAKALPGINRRIPGFEDFALEGVRGIEPGKPARSLLFHALASPQVIAGVDGKTLKVWPSPGEIEAVENYVYGVEPPSIHDLRVRADGAPLAVVVFCSEYRPGIYSVHQRHAEMCFSRVGVSRVGTAPHKYEPNARGYLQDADSPHDVRVLPCRYAAYIAVQKYGDRGGFGPARFQEASKVTRDVDGEPVFIQKIGDKDRKFWVPLHKLFDGPECIRHLNLTLRMSANHVNEKLSRVHRALGLESIDTGWHGPILESPPFKFTSGIAEFSTDTADGSWLLVPTVHAALVELAKFPDGKLLTYRVPPDRPPFRSSVIIHSRRTGARTAPEYVHARHRVEQSGKLTDLNDLPGIVETIRRGGYEAVHYLDFTGDGYIDVECAALSLEIPKTVPAYSLVAAVDFFPRVKQQELMQWWAQSVPPDISATIWPENPGPPLTLSDTRYPTNQSLTLKKLNVSNDPRPVFDAFDDTISAIVGPSDSGTDKMTVINPAVNERASFLPDGASGVFAPGWDVSIDRTEEMDPNDDGAVILPGITHLNNYGLGSPFPEDAMLCAALSSFWPAAAPDITRVFAPGNYATTTPLTDEVIGIGDETLDPWDGIRGPSIFDPARKEIAFRAIEYGDYVNAALQKKFNFPLISRITAAEYGARTLAMARVYASVGAVKRADKIRWAVFSFREARADDPERIKAEKSVDVRLSTDHTYWFKLFKIKLQVEHPTDHRAKLVSYDEMLTFLSDPQSVLRQEKDGTWVVFRY